MSLTDRIIDLIDEGLATAPSASDQAYGPVGTDSDQCWRCLAADPTGASGLCDDCRTVLVDEDFSTGVHDDAAMGPAFSVDAGWAAQAQAMRDHLTGAATMPDCSGMVTQTLHVVCATSVTTLTVNTA